MRVSKGVKLCRKRNIQILKNVGKTVRRNDCKVRISDSICRIRREMECFVSCCHYRPLLSWRPCKKNRSMEIVSELIREVVDTIAHNKPPSMLRRVIEKPVTCADPKTFHFPRIAAGAICFCFISYLYHYRFIQKYGNFPIERNNVSFLSLRNDL